METCNHLIFCLPGLSDSQGMQDGRMVVNEPATNLSRPLAKLLDLGCLEKDIPFGESRFSQVRHRIHQRGRLYRPSPHLYDYF